LIHCALHKSFEVDARRRISSGRRDSHDENWPVIQADAFGSAPHRGWEIKRSLSGAISTSAIDRHYAQARSAGALGGKLAGTGGGGFPPLYCPSRHSRVCARRSMDCLASSFASTGAGGASRSRSDRCDGETAACATDSFKLDEGHFVALEHQASQPSGRIGSGVDVMRFGGEHPVPESGYGRGQRPCRSS
jgi:hypothetical protein